MSVLKEPERITLVDGLTLLERHIPAEEAKTRLRQAFIQKAIPQQPEFAFPYDGADVDWATGSVKIPRKRERFCPSFSRAAFNEYFFRDGQTTIMAEATDDPTAGSSAAAPPMYARETVIAAADMLKALGHTGFDRFLLEINLSDSEVKKDSGLLSRATSLAKFAINNPTKLSPKRRTIPYEIIRRATALWQQGTANNLQGGERERFEWAMKRDGQVLALTGEYHGLIQLDEPLYQVASMKSLTTFSRKIFIVHGHDEAPREAVARFLEKLGFEAIILHEQANKGRTVIEKVEAHGDVGFAVVLLTPDDEGCTMGENPGPRARQNVILELGYFIGRLGRERVCALKRGEIEIPSDFGGVVYEPFDSSGGWKQKLGRELQAVDYEIDWNTVMRP